jgi:hypothetical protein
MSREVESGQSRDIETGPRMAMTWNLLEYERLKMTWESVSCELLQAPFIKRY